jgi:glycine hydroxymethyltransferase
MGPDEMKQIAKIIKLVVSNTQAGILTTGPNAGEPSKRLHTLDAKVRDEARAMIKELLDRFPVYPQLDLAFLQEHFAK